MREKRTVMAIGGHIGDMELTAGGTLATLSLEGDDVVIVALTAGERGNPPHLSVADYRVQKVEEARKFAEALNGRSVVFDYPDGELPDNDEVRWRLCDVIREFRPALLITHWKNSIHKDHAATYRIVKDAQFYAGLGSIERELPACYAAGPYYAENWEDPTDFKPHVYQVVSNEGFLLWKTAIDYHWFVTGSKSFEYKKYYEHLKVLRGMEARKYYAECFNIEEFGKRRYGI